MTEMNPNNPIFAAVFASTLAGFGLLSGCGVGEASVADADNRATTPVPVEITTPFRSDIYATYSASASISSDADAPVSTRVAGEVVELVVEEGDRVTVGQLLARLDGERLRLEMLSAKANLERAKKDYQRNIDLHKRGLVSASMFEGLEFDLASLKATYDLKQLNYGYSNIRAPIAGIVSSRDIKSGQSVTVGQVAFRITETSELIAYLQIPQVELKKFSAGHTATVSVASMPDANFSAEIIRISPTIDARNGTFRATALIDNKAGHLAPGMFGRFTIAYEKHANALVISSDALLDEDNETTVYVVRDGAVVRRTIVVGVEERGHVEVLGGLQEDDQIVVVGHAGLREGSKVFARVANRDRISG